MVKSNFFICFSIEKNFFYIKEKVMQEFLDGLLNVVQTVNAYLSDYILIILLVGVGIFYTIKTRFVQVRCFKQGMKQVFGNLKLHGGKQKSGMSSFQAFATAVAAQVGTGNIIGASGAILAGGPGAIFWMWVIAFFGMATNYSEAVLAQRTKLLNPDGSVSGGPVYYIKQAFKGKFGKFLAGFFAVATIIALGFVGSMVQSNSIAGAVQNVTGLSDDLKWIIGLVIALLAAAVFIGGVSRLASVTEKIVPVMACIYLLGGLIIICCNITVLPEAFAMIFKFAFVPQAVIGGGIGAALKMAISQGAKRGLFSNEAGMGSTPHAHAQANVDTAHQQGVSAMIGVFFDTFVVLTMTALVVITSLYAGDGVLLTPGSADALGINKNNLVQNAIANVFNGSNLGLTIGGIFVAVCLFFFAFSTILSWNLFGKINFTYLFGKKSVLVYTIIAIAFVFLGSIFQSDLVWELTDFFNYLMVLPNVLAMFALSKLVINELKTNGKKSVGKTPNVPLDEKLGE